MNCVMYGVFCHHLSHLRRRRNNIIMKEEKKKAKEKNKNKIHIGIDVNNGL